MKITSHEQLDRALEELAFAEARLMKKRSDFEIRINELKKQSERETVTLEKQCDSQRGAIEDYCRRIRKEFDAEPTKKFAFGQVSFKANPERIECLPGWTETKSIDKALALKGVYRDALVTTHRLNKDVLKSWTQAALAKIGLTIKQGETFAIKVKKVVLQEA